MLRAISASTEANAAQVIQGLRNDPEAFEALRYVTTPPISEDDLKTLADTKLSRRALRDRAAATRVYALLKETLDLRRFPCHHNRPMNRRQTERALASTTALLTAQYIQTRRRNDAKLRQEKAVKDVLDKHGFQESSRRAISGLGDAPGPGTYYSECRIERKKADIIVGVPGPRIIGIECKVSNSAVNSEKRIGEALNKMEQWERFFGKQIVTIAVIGGVFDPGTLMDAQGRGLGLFWEHDLQPLSDWIGRLAG